MTLRVALANFAEAVRAHLDTDRVYLHTDSVRLVASAGDKGGTLVLAAGTADMDAFKAELELAGLKPCAGVWASDDDAELLRLPWIAAVGYYAGEGQIGVWVEAYKDAPNEIEVVQDMLQEFGRNGEIGEISTDQFVSLAKPQVQIVGPVRLAEYLSAKGSNR